LKSAIISHTIRFNFDDKEQDEEKQQKEMNEHIIPQISRGHLPRVDTGLLLKRTFSNPEDNDIIKEPKSASCKLGGNSHFEKENIDSKPSRFAAQKQKSERIIICKGDLTNDFNLPEEEV